MSLSLLLLCQISPVDLARAGESLWVADATGSQVIQVDLTAGKVVRSIPVPAPPTGLAVGDRLCVTAGKVFVIDPNSGRIEASIKAGHTPSAPVLHGSILYVCNRFTDDLSIIDLRSRKELERVKVSREPVAAALTPDGKLLAVAHRLHRGPSDRMDVAAEVHLVDTSRREVIARVRLPAGGIDARGICVSPDGRRAYVSHVLARNGVPATQIDNGWLVTSGVSVIDLENRILVGSVVLDDVARGAANPWGIACSADGSKLFVALAGVHEIAVVDVPAMLKRLEKASLIAGGLPAYERESSKTDLGFLRGTVRRVRLAGKGPRSVRVVGGKVFAGMYFSGSLETIDPGGAISLGESTPMTKARRGEMLFNDATLSFQGWLSCATCHPDGRSDGLNWDLTNDGIGNTKNSKSLLFSHETPPVTATGLFPSLDACVPFEVKTILFSGAPERDTKAIAAYLKTLRPVPPPRPPDDKTLARGREVFRKAGCADCHKGVYYTGMKMTDVGTRVLGDRREKFDVPTLREVWRTAPYLHDGRAATILEIFTKFNADDRHGETSGLTRQEFRVLIDFVRSR